MKDIYIDNIRAVSLISSLKMKDIYIDNITDIQSGRELLNGRVFNHRDQAVVSSDQN